MTTFDVVLPLYDQHTVTLDQNLFLKLFPGSRISSVLTTSTNSGEITIQDLSVTPGVLDILEKIQNDQPVTLVDEDTLASASRYLGIPALAKTTDWYPSATSPNFLPLFGLYNALLLKSDLTEFLEMLAGEEFNPTDETLLRSIITEASQQNHSEVVQRCSSYP